MIAFPSGIAVADDGRRVYVTGTRGTPSRMFVARYWL